MRIFYGENLKKIHMIFFNKCCLNIVLFSLIFCNCYIIVFSLVDFKPGGCGFKSRLCQKKFLFFFFTFFSFSFFEYIESVFGSNIAPPPPPPPHFFIFLILYNTFMYLVQYLLLLVHIPHTPHHPLPPTLQHCVHIHPSPTTQPTRPHPTPPDPDPPPSKFFFF